MSRLERVAALQVSPDEIGYSDNFQKYRFVFRIGFRGFQGLLPGQRRMARLTWVSGSLSRWFLSKFFASRLPR